MARSRSSPAILSTQYSHSQLWSLSQTWWDQLGYISSTWKQPPLRVIPAPIQIPNKQSSAIAFYLPYTWRPCLKAGTVILYRCSFWRLTKTRRLLLRNPALLSSTYMMHWQASYSFVVSMLRTMRTSALATADALLWNYPWAQPIRLSRIWIHQNGFAQCKISASNFDSYSSPAQSSACKTEKDDILRRAEVSENKVFSRKCCSLVPQSRSNLLACARSIALSGLQQRKDKDRKVESYGGDKFHLGACFSSGTYARNQHCTQ